ncbi:centaurin-gamma-1A-like [Sycon ciliatum]|uniref:centaurin-gamma-1A-like n=1 Tax=Sycon ciliatum TaxID=27933 RepID=UPI0020AE5097|eukprot:scpid9143/ scgid4758/ Arf-GAP with GTPase, ANK repeat and PH domain-containing protein 3; CRAM-associated GTPase; Centaurin-gamma-3; MR1-interacting protein
MAHPPSASGSDAVRQDIRTFESSRQAMRAVKSQLDALKDEAQRSNILNQWSKVEGALMESQEWTLPRSIPERRLVVVGSPVSCKTQVIQRFVYGNQPPPISCQDGRYKKEVAMDNQSTLLLIRDVTSSPSAQVCEWADSFLLVFSVCDELSFNLLASYHSRITDYCSDRSVPVQIVMVGTQDAITDSKPRKVRPAEIHKLAIDLGKLEYYEVNAIHGVNIERAFLEVLQLVSSAQSQEQQPLPVLMTPPATSNSAPAISVQSASPPASHKKSTRKKPSRFQHKTSLSDVAPKVPLGTGRDIPVKQGFLNKRSSGLQKDWKRKYVTLTDKDITYYPSMNDYMENEHGKSLSLQRISVKIPGTRPNAIPRQTSSSHTGTTTPSETSDREQVAPTSPIGFLPASPTKQQGKYSYDLQQMGGDMSTSPHRLEADSSDREGSRPNSSFAVNGDDEGIESEDGSQPRSRSGTLGSTTKKGHRRHRSWGLRETESLGEENTEFQIVSLNKCWTLEAPSFEERLAWTKAIEKQILASLGCSQSAKATRGGSTAAGATEEIRKVDGNDFCADCVSPNPEWASLNFGSLLCIQCSAVHRQLGAHLSRVRSLELDEWSPDLVELMVNLGNSLARDMYEALLNQKGLCRLPYSATREERDVFIHKKYVDKEFLEPWTTDMPSLGEQLLDACQQEDCQLVFQLLAHCTAEDVNMHYGAGDGRTALHVACALGNVVLTLLLIWNGANVNATDSNGRIPLVYARTAKHTACIEILLQNESRADNSDDAPIFVTDQRLVLDTLQGKYV